MFPHRFLILIVAMVLLASASAWAVADELEDILQAGVIRIGVPQDLPPFGSVTSSGQLEGYDVDVARLVAKDLGVKLELVPVASVNRQLNCGSYPVDTVTGCPLIAHRPRQTELTLGSSFWVRRYS